MLFRSHMEATRYGDSIVMVHNLKKYRKKLYTEVDTTNTSYVARAYWSVVSPETIGTGANQKTRIREIPYDFKVTVPFSLGNDLCKSTLKGFFAGLTNMGLPAGVTSLQDLQSMEPFGSMSDAIDATVNLVPTPDSEDFDNLIDEDVSDVE